MKTMSKFFAVLMAAMMSMSVLAQQNRPPQNGNNSGGDATAISGAVGVGVGVGVGISDVDVNVRNTNTNMNFNNANANVRNSNRQMQGQLQGQLQGQQQSNINGSATSGNNQVMGGQTTTVGGQSMTYNEAAIPTNVTIKNTPSFAAGNVYPTAPCMGGTQVGGAGAGFGFSVGSSWTDTVCQGLEVARSFEQAGYREDALVLRCQIDGAQKAPSCIALKAKEEAAAASANAAKQAAIKSQPVADKEVTAEKISSYSGESTIFSLASAAK